MGSARPKRKRKSTPDLADVAVPRTRAEMRMETREQIRRAAFELFSSVGYDETTTSAIAKRAGVAAGTVFVHATDKVDLLSLVMHDLLDEVVAERFSSLPDAPLVDRFVYVFHGVFAMYARHPKMAAAFVKNLPGARGPNSDRVNTLTFGFFHRLGQLVTEAQLKGEVAKDLNPILCAQNVFGLYFMTLMTWLSGHVPLEALEPLLRTSLELQYRGFRP
ncbi:MAG: TetR/AcrR family transcriptional regulator [Labilithrix sp.]